MNSERKLEQLGRLVADGLGEGPSVARRQLLGRRVERLPIGRRDRRILLFGFSAAAAVALVVALLLFAVPGQPDFWVGELPGFSGTWLQTEAEPVPIRFEDGTQFELQTESEGRVIARPMDVHFALGRGAVRAVIRPNQGRWTVEAGPYSVTALGTVFTVGWQSSPPVLAVRVERGSVAVRGQEIGGEGLKLSAGDELSVDGQTNEVTLKLAPTPSLAGGVPIPPAEPAPEPVKAELVTIKVEPDPRSLRSLDPRSPLHVADREARLPQTWKELHLQGRHAEAVAAALRLGLGDLLNHLDDTDLWMLSSAARTAGQADVAIQVLTALRARFGGTWRARVAAFLLGRVAFDLQGQPDVAAGWFRTYLREDPDGALAEEALGRLIDACRQAGLHREAMEAAQAYLDRHHDGAFTPLARSVLGL